MIDKCRRTGKISHPTPDAAQQHLAAIRRKRPRFADSFKVYQCKTCGLWHVGDSRRRQVRYRAWKQARAS